MSDTPGFPPPAEPELIQTDETISPEQRADLNDLEAQVLARFEQESADPDTSPPGDPSDSEQVGAEGEGGTGKPADPSAPPQAPGQQPPPEQVPAPAVEPTPGPGDHEVQLSPEDRFAQMTPEQRESAIHVSEWAASLDDTAMQTVDAALSGDYVLVPITDLPAIQRFYQAQQASPGQPAPPPVAQPNPNAGGLPADPRWQEPPLFGDGDDLLASDPRFQQMYQQVQQLTAEQQRAREAQVITWTKSEIEQGAAGWWSDPANADLTAEDRARLEDAVIRSGAYAAQASVHDPRTAIYYAFQQAAATDPVISQRRIDRQVAERLEQERNQLAQQQQRNVGTTALAGTSSPPSGMQAPPMDPDTALVNDIARALQGASGNA